MDRRLFLQGFSVLGLMGISTKAEAFDLFGKSGGEGRRLDKEFPFQLSDEEWQTRLTPEQYKILRSEGTERSCSSPLNDVADAGKFYCVGCGHLLFSTDAKFKSDSGWPSFYEPHDEHAVGTSTDYKIGYARTEVHCANCGGHLGHVFKDGPPPTGLRYCINGTVLDYVKDEG